jgi:cysteine synthase B
MKAFGAEFILTSKEGSMELARDTALKMQKEGKGFVLDQFSNLDNPKAHYKTTGPEIWKDTQGRITHFIASMGTTGTIVGTSQFLKEKNKNIQIIGVQPEEGAQIPGIRKWPEAYLPKIYSAKNIDRIEYVSQQHAEETARRLAKEEGIFAGASTGGGLYIALQIAKANKDAVIVSIACDRGDRYLSSNLFLS